jgi:hypothetical protein
MASDERGPNPGHDHDEGALMEEQDTTAAPTSDRIDADAGGRAHTPVEEGHPDLEGSRSDRDLGGPKLAPEDLESAEDTTGGAKGDIQTKGHEPHQ